LANRVTIEKNPTHATSSSDRLPSVLEVFRVLAVLREHPLPYDPQKVRAAHCFVVKVRLLALIRAERQGQFHTTMMFQTDHNTE